MPIDRLILVASNDLDDLACAVVAVVDLGYAVLRAESGESALAVLAENPGVDLLLVDLGGQGADMAGAELARRARALSPKLHVLHGFAFPELFQRSGEDHSRASGPRVPPLHHERRRSSRFAGQVERVRTPVAANAA